MILNFDDLFCFNYFTVIILQNLYIAIDMYYHTKIFNFTVSRELGRHHIAVEMVISLVTKYLSSTSVKKKKKNVIYIYEK